MSFNRLSKQLVRDLKASWQKTLVLGILLCVGCCFWIPPIVRAMSKKSNPPAPQAAAVAPMTLPVDLQTGTAASATEKTGSVSWKSFDQWLQEDPLLMPVAARVEQTNPFAIDENQFSPPILFAEEPPPAKPVKKKAVVAEGPQTINGLVLKTTIMGAQRRAALINEKLYFEGREVRHAEKVYRLQEVHPRKVLLACGEELFELELSEPAPTARIEIQKLPTSN